MLWDILTAVLTFVGLVVQLASSGPTWLLTASGLSQVANLFRLLGQIFPFLRKYWRKTVLWVLNEPLEWEIRGSFVCGEDAVPRSTEELRNFFLEVLQKNPRLKARFREYSVQGEPTRFGLALFHRALGAALSFRITRYSPVGVVPAVVPAWQVVVSFNASIGYRQTASVLTGVVNTFFIELEQKLRPSSVRYEASIATEQRNPFAGAFVQQLPKDHVRSFNVLADLSARTKLQVSERRVSLISDERSDFMLQAQDLLHKVA